MQPGLQPFDTSTEAGRKRASDAGKKGAATREANRKRAANALAQLEHQTDLMQQAAQDVIKPGDIPATCEAAIEHTIHRVNMGELQLPGNAVADYLLALNTIARLAKGQATTHTATTTITTKQTTERLKQLQATNTNTPHKPEQHG